jgi:hypothetical protein
MSETLDGLVTCRVFHENGISARELYVWTDRGLLIPSNPHPGSGHRMLWPASEVHIARMMSLLVEEADMRPRGAARAARNSGRLAPGIRILVDREELQL